MTIGNPSKKLPAWCEARIMRKSYSTPVVVREYMDECWKGTEPWRSHSRRRLRHKALAQCVRLAFGMSGVCADPDDAEPVTVQASVYDEHGRQTVDVNAAIEQAVEVKPAPQPASKPTPGMPAGPW